MMFFRTCVCLLVVVCTSLSAQTPVSWKDLQANIDSWLEGPVQLILTDEEKKVFKKLQTPEEKMQFIKIFWGRRDPILRTRANEFKEEFYRRVEYADEKFAEKNDPGWKTARGRVYVTFGPPSRVDHQSVPGSSRPALLWVYDTIPSQEIPRNEALMFVFRDFKYVLMPPNPDPGDVFAEEQRQMDSAFRYQDIPGSVEVAFADVAQRNVVDERKNYESLLFSVRSTEKFGIAEIPFEIRIADPSRVSVAVPPEEAPVYDDGIRTFAEFYFVMELKKGDEVIARKEHDTSFTWSQEEFSALKEIVVPLPGLSASPGDYELWVTVQDRISSVAETRKVPFPVK